METISNNNFNTTTTKTYWCHLCKKEFSRIFIEGFEVTCRLCSKNFCEEITRESSEDHPSAFIPYEPTHENSKKFFNIPLDNNQSNSVSSNNSRSSNNSMDSFSLLGSRANSNATNAFRRRTFYLEILNGLMNFQEDSDMDNIINMIMMNDPNRYGNPPAAKKAVDGLEKFSFETEEKLKEFNRINGGEECLCAVCKDQFEINQTIVRIPCNHYFHDDCIYPWLKDRNSCPTCRFELPTEDEDYEKSKTLYRRNNNNNGISSNANNSNNFMNFS